MSDAPYVPTNLDDALLWLDENAKDAADAIGNRNAESHLLHHGFGTGLRNRWGLWHGSALAKWFNALGILHADDMSGIILEAWGARILGKRFDLNKRVKFYINWWAKQGLKPDGSKL